MTVRNWKVTRKLYPSDLSGEEWGRIKSLIPTYEGIGRKTVERREKSIVRHI